MLITTYEGNHNHPLPPAATAMANTTSAAAAMLLSGSTRSKESSTNSGGYFSSMPYASMATLSASAPFPTITLDLTHTHNGLHLHRLPTPGVSFPLPLMGHPMLRVPAVPVGQRQGASPSSSMVETMTAAIASDPNFTAVLTAAISSIFGSNVNGNGVGNVGFPLNGVSVSPGSPQLPQSCTTLSTN